MLPVLLRDKIVIVENESQRMTRPEPGRKYWTPEDQEDVKNVFGESVKICNPLPVRIKQRDELVYCIMYIL